MKLTLEYNPDTGNHEIKVNGIAYLINKDKKVLEKELPKYKQIFIY